LLIVFGSLNIPRILESKVGLQQETSEASNTFNFKLGAMPTQSVSYPTSISLFAFAMLRLKEIFLAPCSIDASTDTAAANEALSCKQRKYSLKLSDPSRLRLNLRSSSLGAGVFPVSVAGSISDSERIESQIEYANLALLWAQWKVTTRRASNTAFVYAYSPTHYRNLLRSRDHFFGVRTVDADKKFSSRSKFISTAELFNIMDSAVLLGYLQRRYQYRGKYLKIGCLVTTEKNEYMDMSIWSAFDCVDDETPSLSSITVTSSISYMQSLLVNDDGLPPDASSGESMSTGTAQYDLIFIDGYHHQQFVYEQAVLALQLLSPDGTLVISNARLANCWLRECRRYLCVLLQTSL
jgi:hypothetical protein